VHPRKALYARSTTTGSVIWHHFSPLLVGGVAHYAAWNKLVACTRTGLVFFDIANRTVDRVVNFPSDSGIPCLRGVPVIRDLNNGPAVFVGTTRGTVIATDLAGGTQLWVRNLGASNAIAGPLSEWGTKLVAATYSGRIYLIEASTGATAGSYQTPDVTSYIPNGPIFGVRSGTLVVENVLYYSTAMNTDNFVALDLSTLTKVWSATPSTGFTGYTTPTFLSPNILTTTVNGQFVALLATDGSIVGSFCVCRPMLTSGPVALMRNVALLQTNYGHLVAVDALAGVQLDVWYNYRIGTLGSTPGVSGNQFFQAGGLMDSGASTNCL